MTFAADTDRPLLRAVWCARAYREFDGLYDVSVSAVTEDRDHEALVSRLNMRGITYENALALGRRFLGAIEWAPGGTKTAGAKSSGSKSCPGTATSLRGIGARAPRSTSVARTTTT